MTYAELRFQGIINLMNNDARPIVWIVHPRSFQDIEKEMPILKIMPSFIKGVFLLCIPPYKASSFSDNGHFKGFVIAVPLLPIHFQKYKVFSAFRLDQAFKLAKKLGAKKVSVGGMITTLAEKTNLGSKYGLEVFDGTDLIAQLTARRVSDLILENRRQISSVGIIGATTKSGSRLAKYLSTEQIQNLHLFAKTAVNVRSLAEECRRNSSVNIIDHVDLSAIKECDVCILTAFIPDAGPSIVSNLKQDSVFLSVIEPTSPFVDDIEKNRPDVQLTKGINIKAPSLSYAGLDSVIPSGNAFSCLAEALIADKGMQSQGPSAIETTLKANNLQIA